MDKDVSSDGKGDDTKKKKIVDKVIMGAVIGGAIGSVLGATIAPKKGKETRKDIAKAAKKAKNSSGIVITKVKNFINRIRKNKKEEDNEYKKIPTEVEE